MPDLKGRTSEAVLEEYARACFETGHAVATGAEHWSAEDFRVYREEILRRMTAGNEGK